MRRRGRGSAEPRQIRGYGFLLWTGRPFRGFVTASLVTATRLTNFMKNVARLLLIIGLLVAGWVNREKLHGLGSGSSTFEATPTPTPALAAPPASVAEQRPPATPHPAKESQEQAIKLYPALTHADSELHKKFAALYEDARRSNPDLLARPDWPMKLAERAMVGLGGAPLPVPTPTPKSVKPLPPTTLDAKPAVLDVKPPKAK